jgi:hypothetical protein
VYKFQVSYLPIIRNKRFIGHHDLKCHEQLLDILRASLAGNGYNIKAVGTTFMSRSPEISELISADDGPFIPQEHFESALFSDPMHLFVRGYDEYVLQFIPFIYSGKTLVAGVLDINALIELNVLARESHFYSISYGPLREAPTILLYASETVDIVNNLVAFYTNSVDKSSEFILPFYTLEHFIGSALFPDEVMTLYEHWLVYYCVYRKILTASRTPHKIVLGLEGNIFTKSLVPLSERQKNSVHLSDFYKSPRTTVSEKIKENCDTVNIETFNCFDNGDIVTLISWQRNGRNQVTEFYYHVTDDLQFLDEFQKECDQNDLNVNRANLDFHEELKRLDILKIKPGLH